MRRIYWITFICLIISLVTVKSSAMEIQSQFLQLIHGDRNVSVVASGDTNQDKKNEILLSTQYVDCLNAYSSGTNFLIMKPFSYMKGELSTLAVADLNQNGVNEIIYGHREVFNSDGPSISIIEKIDSEYKVI